MGENQAWQSVRFAIFTRTAWSPSSARSSSRRRRLSSRGRAAGRQRKRSGGTLDQRASQVSAFVDAFDLMEGQPHGFHPIGSFVALEPD